MRKARVIAGVLTGLALLAAPAFAKPAPAADQAPHKPAPVAQHSAPLSAAERAAIMLARVHGEGLFVIMPSATDAAFRHRRSGLECDFGPNDNGDLLIFENRDIPRGDDVGCNVQAASGTHTFYATHYALPTDLDTQFQGAVGMIETRYPSAERLNVSSQPTPPGEVLPESKSAYFSVEGQDGRTLTMVSIAMVDNWVFMMRYSGPLSAQPQADALWRDMLHHIQANRSL